MNNIYLYGAPGSGKSTIGRELAKRLGRDFSDLDYVIESKAGASIREIFEKHGELYFRQVESEALAKISKENSLVVSLGGGALLKEENRKTAEATGRIVFLETDAETLAKRCALAPGKRPLSGSKSQNEELLRNRAEHYASFPLRVRNVNTSVERMVNRVQEALGLFRITGMGAPYEVHVAPGLIDNCPFSCASNHAVIVGDTNTLPLYGERLANALKKAGCKSVSLAQIPAGEATKNIATVGDIWRAFLKGAIERRDSVFALGGGVVGDLTGFAAATWLRGVSWVGVPTTLLAMVDSSLGGKTGADLPEGKNLIGAFHPPALVMHDTDTLSTLPVEELRCGFAEAIKHAIIADPGLLNHLPPESAFRDKSPEVPLFVARALAVKARVIAQDPLEKGIRAALNLGHTIGHGIEKATDFRVKHGEGVAIGTVLETRISEKIGLAPKGLAETVRKAFASVGLPTSLPQGIDVGAVKEAMTHDKKKAAGVVRFALPAALGDVRTGIVVPQEVINEVLR